MHTLHVSVITNSYDVNFADSKGYFIQNRVCSPLLSIQANFKHYCIS